MCEIRQLGVDVQSRLAAGPVMTSAAQCVEELMLNCLDAGATCVAVRVEMQFYYKLSVVDNGEGIHRANMDVLGNR